MLKLFHADPMVPFGADDPFCGVPRFGFRCAIRGARSRGQSRDLGGPALSLLAILA